jgi:hypothetical protein
LCPPDHMADKENHAPVTRFGFKGGTGAAARSGAVGTGAATAKPSPSSSSSAAPAASPKAAVARSDDDIGDSSHEVRLLPAPPHVPHPPTTARFLRSTTCTSPRSHAYLITPKNGPRSLGAVVGSSQSTTSMEGERPRSGLRITTLASHVRMRACPLAQTRAKH